jgi:hypothetical protein
LTRVDTQAILNASKKLANTYKFINAENGWNGYNVLHRNQGQINALELGLEFKPPANEPKIIFLLGCDNNILPEDIPKGAFVVYIVSAFLFRDPTEIKVHSMLMLFYLLPLILKGPAHMVKMLRFSQY